MSQGIPPVAILVAHRVTDYDTWKKAFDSHTSARKEATCLGHDINREIDDPKMVYVYCPATDTEKVRAFVGSPDLGEVMKDAGVESAPTVTFMRPMSADFIADRKLPGIIVTHAVEDYDRWRTAYDEFDVRRKSLGIVGHAVNQELGEPNRVIVYHQAEDADSLRAFVDSTELREVMQGAGVVGAPEIRLVRSEDIAEY
jgi:quinol monooxygenase YgiN